MKNGMRSSNRLKKGVWKKLGAHFQSKRVHSKLSLNGAAGLLQMNEKELAAFENGNGVSESQLLRINRWLAGGVSRETP